MSFTPLPPEPEALRARDQATTTALVSRFLAARQSRAESDALEIRTLADAAALVGEQRARLTSRAVGADIPGRSMVAELAVAANVSERTVQRQLDEAADLCDRFAALVDALSEARVSLAHVRVIHDAGFGLDDDDARDAFVAASIAKAKTMAPGRLRPIVQVMAARVDERTVQERFDKAHRERSVRVVDDANGMAHLDVFDSALLVHAMYDRLTQDAHAVIEARPGARGGESALDLPHSPDSGRVAGEPDQRTMDHLRADILSDLVLTGTPSTCVEGEGVEAIRATVQITLPLLTAMGASDEPALLAGFGPIDPETARRMAAGAKGWERVMTSPVTGAVLCVDRYRPGNDLKRFLAARDERCRFPGCRQPVWRCDIDHTVDAAHGGPTACSNLAHLCRRHHVLKHNSAWMVRQLDGGVLEWTSPTGRVYTDLPEPVVRFTPEPVSGPPRRRMDFRDPTTWPNADVGDPPVF